MWTRKEIEKHKKSAEALLKIKDYVFGYISQNKNISEYDLQQYVLKNFKEFNLKTDRDPPIVAFGANTSKVHHFPTKKSKLLKQEDLILIDFWARLKAPESPFADITWMAYNGDKIPDEIQKIWKIVLEVRDRSIQCLESRLKRKLMPSGREINQIAKSIMKEYGLEEVQNYYSGHCLGFTSAHGNKANLTLSNKKPLIKNVGYTLEPGIYIKNKYGLRSEINFFISDSYQLIFTTDLQKKIFVL